MAMNNFVLPRPKYCDGYLQVILLSTAILYHRGLLQIASRGIHQIAVFQRKLPIMQEANRGQ